MDHFCIQILYLQSVRNFFAKNFYEKIMAIFGVFKLLLLITFAVSFSYSAAENITGKLICNNESISKFDELLT